MKPVKKPIWSNLDAFALINGISTWDTNYNNLLYVRKPFETNLDIKDKIHRYHDNKPNVTKQGLINALYNEFELTPYNLNNKSIFYLTYNPVPSGLEGVQDISGFYKTSSGTWENIGPQIFSNEYEKAKENNIGFIVWQNQNFANIPGYKNFTYSNIVEIFRILPDNTEVKFEYYINLVDSDNNISVKRYTDMNNQTDSNDQRFTYRISYSGYNLSSDIITYTLNSIPDNIKSNFYDSNNHPKQLLYDIKSYIDNKFNHTWEKLKSNHCIWDVGINYGSGQIDSFYDASAPENSYNHTIDYTGYIGGIDSLSYSLYTTDYVEISGTKDWYFKIYPGKFYIDGISFYYFENPVSNYYTTVYINSGIYSGLCYCSLPSGFQRGMHSIISKSGYYDTYYCNFSRDEYLGNVYEDYSYRTGEDGNKYWTNIYRKRPFLDNSTGNKTSLNLGDYFIDFNNSGIYLNIPNTSDYKNINLIYDQTLVPSGSYLNYNINPLSSGNLNFEKFFLNFSLKPDNYSGYLK